MIKYNFVLYCCGVHKSVKWNCKRNKYATFRIIAKSKEVAAIQLCSQSHQKQTKETHDKIKRKEKFFFSARTSRHRLTDTCVS